MDWELFTKFVLAGVGIFTIWKVLFDTSSGKRSNLRNEYEFAKRFLDETDKKNLHPYTLSKGYQAVAGTTALKVSEIEYTLSLKDPLQCLRDFTLSKQLFERLETRGEFKLIFKSKYSKPFSRWWRKAMYFSLYWILSFFALSPVILSNFFEVKPYDTLLQTLFTLPFFGLYAWMAMKANSKIVRAECLFNTQALHSPKIILGKQAA